MLVEAKESFLRNVLSEAGVLHDGPCRAKDGPVMERKRLLKLDPSLAAAVAVCSDIMSTKMFVLSFIFSINNALTT